MLAIEIVLGVPLLFVLLLLAVAARSRVLQRAGGAVELSLRRTRTGSGASGRGWSNGIGRFVDDELRWYRVFSLWPGPRRRLSRRELEVTGRRTPAEGERRALQTGAVILTCANATDPVELAMQSATVTGFLAWLEARPPGSSLPVYRGR